MRMLLPLIFFTLSGACLGQTQALSNTGQRDGARPAQTVVRPAWEQPDSLDTRRTVAAPQVLGGPVRETGSYGNLGLGPVRSGPGDKIRRCQAGEAQRKSGGGFNCQRR